MRDLLRARAPLPEKVQKVSVPEPEQGAERPSREGRGTAMFLVGAGCSLSAGIPLASKVARTAIVELARDYRAADPNRGDAETPSDPAGALKALISQGHVPARFMAADGEPRWTDLYSYVFSEHIKHPNHQRALISRLVDTENVGLNWSHACLGELVNLQFVHTVLTTNFDQLVLKGIIRTGLIPVVADGLESLIRISASPRWPQVVHVHGSMHTYELRNSYDSLRETSEHGGLQSLMLSVLKETTVLVVVGYSGGEEGIMRLLQEAARALPRMVVYWVAHESDYAALSVRARALLETGEYKYFVLGQDSDDFFNRLLGELGVGPPDWIKHPLAVLGKQTRIAVPSNASEDVRQLIHAYKSRVTYAIAHGERQDAPEDEAVELRSANRYAEAVSTIAAADGWMGDEAKLRLHARSLFDQYRSSAGADLELLKQAVDELAALAVADGDLAVRDAEYLIEAKRELFEKAGEGSEDLPALALGIEQDARLAQARTGGSGRYWALMEFYVAEGMQLQSDVIKRSADGENEQVRTERARLLTEAAAAYEAALPVLSAHDVVKSNECKEGLAGALVGLAEIRPGTIGSRAGLRQAKTLFKEVIAFASMNMPDKHPDALANLAGMYDPSPKRRRNDSPVGRAEAVALLQEAEALYREIGDEAEVDRIRSRLLKAEE